MAKYNVYDDDITADDELLQDKGRKKIKLQKMTKMAKIPKEERVNKRMSGKLNRNIEKTSVDEKKSIETMLNKIMAGATIKFPDNSELENARHVIRVTGSEPEGASIEQETNSADKLQGVKNKGRAIVRVEYGPVVKNSGSYTTPEEFCKNINLKFVTNDTMVLKIFQDPLNIPKGTKYLIVDQYFEFGCICSVEQIVKKNKGGTMIVFKRGDTGGITTYTDASIKDAKEIRHIK